MVDTDNQEEHECVVWDATESEWREGSVVAKGRNAPQSHVSRIPLQIRQTVFDVHGCSYPALLLCALLAAVLKQPVEQGSMA